MAPELKEKSPKTEGEHDKLGDMTAAERAESDQLLASAGDKKSYYTGSRGKGGKQGNFWQKRKKGIVAGSIIGVLGVGGFAGFFLLQGPFQILQMGNLLREFHFTNNEEAVNSRTTKLIRWMRYPDKENRRLGIVKNKFADKIEANIKDNGFSPRYNDAGYLEGYDIDPAKAGQAQLDELHARGLIDSPSATSMDLSGETNRTRRGVIRFITRSHGLNVIPSAIQSRVLIKKAGVRFQVFGNVQRKAAEAFADFKKRFKQDEEKAVTKDEHETRTQPAEKTNEDGASESNPESEGAVEDIDGSKDGVTPDDTPATRTQKIRNNLSFKIGASATAGVGLFCMIKAIGESAEDLEHANTVLPLMRLGFNTVSGASQVMSGENITMDELRIYSESFYNQEDKSSWASARSVQAEEGRPLNGPDIPTSAKPDGASNLFSQISGAVGPIGGTVCGALNSTLGQIGQIALDIVGGGFLFSQALEQSGVVDLLVGEAAKYIAGDVVNTDVAGAEFGNMANYGVRYAANEQAISMGGRALSNSEVAILDRNRNEIIAEETKYASIKERLFSTDSPHSLLARTAMNMPSPKSMAKNLLSGPQNLLASIKNIPDAFFAKTQAQEAYDYGFPEFGFSQAELDDPIYDNPYAIADLVEPNLDTLNKKYGQPCFGVTMRADGTFNQEAAKPYNKITDNPNCTDYTNQEFNLYRFYVLDSMAAGAVACYEGDESLCSSFGATERTQRSQGVGSVNCDSAEGNAKILCAAKSFTGVPYKATGPTQFFGHPPSAWLPGYESGDPAYNFLDCSGLTNVAIYVAFGEDVNLCSGAYLTDPRFKEVPIDEGKPGDIVISRAPNCGPKAHVAVFESYNGSSLTITDAGRKGVSSRSGDWMRDDGGFHVMRYIGPGSSP